MENPQRRFTILDGMVLVAVLAIGILLFMENLQAVHVRWSSWGAVEEAPCHGVLGLSGGMRPSTDHGCSIRSSPATWFDSFGPAFRAAMSGQEPSPVLRSLRSC